MKPFMMFVLDFAVFLVCALVAFNSALPVASALWGFSAGVWFTMSLKYFFK